MTRIVELDEELEELAVHLKSCRQVGVDIEGDGMFHFREKVCLLQLSDGIDDWIVDPLKAKNISILAPFFFDPGVEKIFHGGDYDIKSLYRDYGIVVNNMFDTEIASRFAGLKYSGLDHLMMDFLGVKTEKKYQKKDWSKRPLTDNMLLYAAMDAHYLIEISDILKDMLKDLKRLYWVHEESFNISEARFFKKSERPHFKSFKGAGRLDRRSLAVLEGILKFRYRLARKKDKPLYKILPNRLIIRVAEKKASSEKELKALMTPGHYKRFGVQIQNIVSNAMQIPSDSLPKYPKKKRPVRFDNSVAVNARKLKEWRAEKSEELDLDPGLIMNNALLAEIAHCNGENGLRLRDIDSLKHWQVKEFKDELEKIIRG